VAFAAGARLGPYEILAAIGAGGMGEVYRARDTKLGRDVALKILPTEFTHDPDRIARFKREAQVLASLNHPHIAAIYGLEEANDSQFLVLELVEGDTLAQRIALGPIPVEEALAIARQIAEALEAAHEKAIIHRDLKPSNIAFTADDRVKVLDFGLAKALERVPNAIDVSQSPTITSPAMMTGTGVILGTAAYMSPEQAKGRPADKRSDVWAFGCVLFEMLTRKRAFEGEDVSDTLAAVLRGDPDWKALPADVRPAIRMLMRRCLDKDRTQRVADISTALFVMDESATPDARAARSGTLERFWIAATCVATIVAAAMTALYVRRVPVTPPEMRLQINTPPGLDTSFAISPDGRAIVFQATTEGKSQLWLRLLESEPARPLPGTEGGAQQLFWSPDSRSIGFSAGQKLKRIDIASGTTQILANAPTYRGGAWTVDDTILFAPGGNGPLYRVPARGGQPIAVTRLASAQQASHRFPSFLPDGRHFLFWVLGTPEARGVYVGSLDSTETHRLFDADGPAVFAPPNHVLFVRQGTLFAQRMDVARLELTGDALVVAASVPSASTGYTAASAATAGPLAYRSTVVAKHQLMWLDRSGKQAGSVGEPDTALRGQLRLSPDGRYAAFVRRGSDTQDIWVIETARGVLRRFTSGDGHRGNPVWSPDSSLIAFNSDRKGILNIYQQPIAAANADEQLLFESSEAKNTEDWSPDGRFILFDSQSPKTARDLWALPLDTKKPFGVAQTPAQETSGRFSSNGHWIAYESNESGRDEILVRAFPGPGHTSQISTTGGTNAAWRHDGREIFYVTLDNRLVAVPITQHTDPPTIDAGLPVALFGMRAGSSYDVSSDGQRFLIDMPLEDASTPPITIVLNWAGALKK
jgi:Tol biopolymer transport system component